MVSDHFVVVIKPVSLWIAPEHQKTPTVGIVGGAVIFEINAALGLAHNFNLTGRM